MAVDGGLTVSDMPKNGIRLYFREIDKKTAKKMIEDCDCWEGLKAYVGDNL